MIRVGGDRIGVPGEDTEFCGLVYPDGDIITRHMAERLRVEPFYQHDKLMDVLPRVRQRRVAVDCGAWVGGWSRDLARRFERVIAIEANPDNARCVSKNVAALPNVYVYNVAIGNQSCMAAAFPEEGGANVGSRVAATGDQPGPIGLQMQRLDDLLRQIDHCDYIKVHVNGMELKALRGAQNTIRHHRPVLTVVLKPALADYGDTPEAARKFLADDLGYRCAGGERPYEIWVPQ